VDQRGHLAEIRTEQDATDQADGERLQPGTRQPEPLLDLAEQGPATATLLRRDAMSTP